jgi:hypothetical protein
MREGGQILENFEHGKCAPGDMCGTVKRHVKSFGVLPSFKGYRGPTVLAQTSTTGGQVPRAITGGTLLR